LNHPRRGVSRPRGATGAAAAGVAFNSRPCLSVAAPAVQSTAIPTCKHHGGGVGAWRRGRVASCCTSDRWQGARAKKPFDMGDGVKDRSTSAFCGRIRFETGDVRRVKPVAKHIRGRDRV
jgi:hypothetical protein